MKDQRRLPERDSYYQLDPNIRLLECLVCARLAVYQWRPVDNLRHYPAGSHFFFERVNSLLSRPGWLATSPALEL